MIPAFITVRSASSRLPAKCFLPFGQSSVLEFVINRARAAGFRVVVCTTENSEDDAIVDLADNCGAESYRGSSNNKMLRWLNCCDYYGFSTFHTIDADDPFFCVSEVSRSMSLLSNNLSIDVVKPTNSSSGGGATVGYSMRYTALKHALSDVAENANTEMIGGILDSTDKLQQVTLPEPDSSVITSRMTLDYWEDYIFLSSVLCLLGEQRITRNNIYELLKNNPLLPKINSFRNEEWAQKQALTTRKKGHLNEY